MKVNKALLPTKAAYYFHMSVFGCFLPFKTLFQIQLGMTYTQNGIIQAVERITRTCMPPVMTAIADKFSVHKFIMISFMLLAICASVPMYFLPKVNLMRSDFLCQFSNGDLVCYDEVDTQYLCTLKLNSTVWNCYNDTLDQSVDVMCQQVEKVYVVRSNTTTCIMQHSEALAYYSSNETYILCIVLTIFQSMFIHTPSPLIDGSAMNTLGPNKIGDYGKQRLFGSIGFGVSGLLTGILIDFYTRVTGQVETDYVVIFWGISFFCLLTAISLLFLNVPKHTAPSWSKGVKKLFKKPHVPLFLFIVFVSGFLIGVVVTYGFLYVSTLPDSSQSIFGFSILITCISEVPMFFISGWIIKYLGCPACICIGLLGDCLRVFLYTVLTSAWQLLLVEPLNAVSFALLFAAVNTYATKLAPKGMNSTMISFTHAIYFGLGDILGTLYGGFVYDKYGPLVMFRMAAAIGVISAILYFLLEYYLKRFCQFQLPVSTRERAKPAIANDCEENVDLFK